MSITKGFEERRVSVPMEEWSEHGTFKYWGDDIERLLKHARALEAMLRKHEWNGNPERCTGECPECGSPEPIGGEIGHAHAPDCQLAKLLEDVE